MGRLLAIAYYLVLFNILTVMQKACIASQLGIQP